MGLSFLLKSDSKNAAVDCLEPVFVRDIRSGEEICFSEASRQPILRLLAHGEYARLIDWTKRLAERHKSASCVQACGKIAQMHQAAVYIASVAGVL